MYTSIILKHKYHIIFKKIMRTNIDKILITSLVIYYSYLNINSYCTIILKR